MEPFFKIDFNLSVAKKRKKAKEELLCLKKLPKKKSIKR